MDKRLFDYNNYDSLHLYVKKEREENIARIYKGLGYELMFSKPNNKYSNIMDLTFVRPHKIENKNELQFLQVELEIELNKIGKTEKNKHSFSISFALTIGVISVLFGVLGIVLLLHSFSVIQKVANFILIFLAFLMFGIGLFFTPKIFNKEKIKFEEKNNESSKKLNEIFEQIKKIRGI